VPEVFAVSFGNCKRPCHMITRIHSRHGRWNRRCRPPPPRAAWPSRGTHTCRGVPLSSYQSTLGFPPPHPLSSSPPHPSTPQLINARVPCPLTSPSHPLTSPPPPQQAVATAARKAAAEAGSKAGVLQQYRRMRFSERYGAGWPPTVNRPSLAAFGRARAPLNGPARGAVGPGSGGWRRTAEDLQDEEGRGPGGQPAEADAERGEPGVAHGQVLGAAVRGARHKLAAPSGSSRLRSAGSSFSAGSRRRWTGSLWTPAKWSSRCARRARCAPRHRPSRRLANTLPISSSSTSTSNPQRLNGNGQQSDDLTAAY
jgi:hypothetical protein